MASKVKFIVCTGEASVETEREHRKMIRSHVTSQRYLGKQKGTSKESRQATRTRNVTLHPPYSSSERSTKATSAPAHENIVFSEARVAQISRTPQETTSSAVSDRTPTDLTSHNDGDELRLEEHGGSLIRIGSPAPFAYVGNGSSDPFTQMPSSHSVRMSKHLHYYVNILMPRMHPSYTTNLNRRTYGCKFMIDADELTLSGISALAATSRAFMSGDLVHQNLGVVTGYGFHEDVFDRLYFKGKLIKLINEKMRDAQGAISDYTLAAIVDLIFMETYTGEIEAVKAHLAGIRRIAALRQRGGPLPYLVAAKVTAAVVKAATLTLTKPIIPYFLTPRVVLPIPGVSHLLPTLGIRLIEVWPRFSPISASSFLSTLNPTHPILPILHDAALFTRHTEAVHYWIYPYAEDDWYYYYINDQNLRIEHRLLSYESNNGIEECCRLAMLLYVNTGMIRGYPPGSAIVSNVVRRLKRVLEKIEQEKRDGIDGGWEEWLNVRLWVLWMGVFCSEGQSEDGWFVEKFRDTAGDLELQTCEEARSLLETFFFVERVYGERLMKIWGTSL